MLSLNDRAELHMWARAEGLSTLEEELADVYARNLISTRVYRDNREKQKLLAQAESRLHSVGKKSSKWNCFEMLVLQFVRAIVESKKEAAQHFWMAGRRAIDAYREMFKKSMLLNLNIINKCYPKNNY